MKRVDFVRWVRLSEYACAENSGAYRRSVALFAALGYAWVLSCLFLGLGVLWWCVAMFRMGAFRGVYFWLPLAALSLIGSTVRALWFRFDAPHGLAIASQDAPSLFNTLEKIRKKIKGPLIHKVILNNEFNASISQHPRWGLFGGTVNYLTLGLPLLMAIDRQRLLSVLIHEYGHLRADHGRYAAWVYRTRLSWSRLEHSLRNESGPIAAVTQSFLRWYFPRFSAKTFALARQDEFEADRLAARWMGAPVAGAALTEISIKGQWLQQEFWAQHWRLAQRQALPVGPYGGMRAMLALAPEPTFAQEALRAALARLSDAHDTHPVLRARLEALNVSKGLPVWSSQSALELLGPKLGTWMAFFDKQWCLDHATEWKHHHARLNRMRQRTVVLVESLERNTADHMVELGELHRRLDAQAPVIAHFQHALKLCPEHAGALKGLVQCMPKTDRAGRIDALTRLHASSVSMRWWASKTAVSLLETVLPDGSRDESRLKLWRDRLARAEEAEERARDDLTHSPFFQSITRDDLSAFEMDDLTAELARFKPVSQAWLVRKHLKEFAYRRCFILWVELPGYDDEHGDALCRILERELPVPGSVLALRAGAPSTLDEIKKNAFTPVYRRATR